METMYNLIMPQAVVAFNPFSALWEGIKQVLGFIMNLIYMFLSMLGIENMALTIILFTIIIYTLLIPLTIKQQRSMKMNALIQPELNAIQKKYKNKKDNESMMKQNEEMQALYKKYGSSPTSGCLTSFIQLPILLALYRVLYNVPRYVSSINDIFVDLSTAIQNTSGYEEKMAELSSTFSVSGLSGSEITSEITEALYGFSNSSWKELTESFPALQSTIEATKNQLSHVNAFILGLDISDSPSSVITSNFKEGNWGVVIVAVMIPVLAGVLSWLSTKVSTAASGMNNDNNKNSSNSGSTAESMQSSLKMMNTIMPIFSVFICFSLQIGIGLYWIFSSFYRTLTSFLISKKMEKLDVMEIVEKNVEKYNKKLEKQGLPKQQVNMKKLANTSVRNTEYDEKQKEEKQQKVKEQIEQSTEYYKNASSDAKPGSLRAKANMVTQYNERNANGSKAKKKKEPDSEN